MSLLSRLRAADPQPSPLPAFVPVPGCALCGYLDEALPEPAVLRTRAEHAAEHAALPGWVRYAREHGGLPAKEFRE